MLASIRPDFFDAFSTRFKESDKKLYFENLTTISTDFGFLWDFVPLSLKTCALYHEKLFIQVVNDISTQVFNNFFSASDTMEAVKGRFCFHKYECKQGCVIQVILLRSML